MRKPPFFKFDVGDFVGSFWVQQMDAEQIGWYLMLLVRSWQADKCCYLPNDVEMLPKLAKADPERFSQRGWLVLQRFKTTDDGSFIYNERLLHEYKELIKAQKAKIEAGRKGGNAKALLQQRHGDAKARPQQPSSNIDVRCQIADADAESKTSCSEASSEPIAGTLPLINGTEYQVTVSERDEWQRLYPAVDVKQEFRSMKGWLIGHPKNRKTARGIKAFINTWLSRSQDRAKPEKGNGETESARDKIRRVTQGMDDEDAGENQRLVSGFQS